MKRFAKRIPHDFRRFIGFPCLIPPSRKVNYERKGLIVSATYDDTSVRFKAKGDIKGEYTKTHHFSDNSSIIPICYDIRKPDLRDFVDFDRECGPFPGRYKFEVINASYGDRFDNWSLLMYSEKEPGKVSAMTIGSPMVNWWERRGYFVGQCDEKHVKFRPVEMGMTEDLFEYFRRNGANPFNWLRICGMSDNQSIPLAREWLDRLRAEGEPIPRYGIFPDGTTKRVD